MEEKNWEKAENWLKEIRDMYTEIGSAGMMALSITINPLFVRFEGGERSGELFDEIMSLE